MQWKIALPILALLFFPLFMDNSLAATSGLSHEVISNDKMQMYVASVAKVDMGGTNFRADVELILKNIEANARAFNPFFAKAVDAEGNEVRLSLLLGSIQPIRIASNDILRGTLAFSLPRDAELSTLTWEEPNSAKLIVDLTKSKDPADPIPKSDWVLSSNKGKTLSDGRTQLTINDELLNRSQTYYAVDISIKNLDKAIIQYNPSFVFVKDQDGFMYPPDIKNRNLLSNPLGRGDLEKGEEVRGQVLFPIPDAVNDVMLIYDESLGTGSYFAVPEFPSHAIVLIASAGTSLILSRIFTNNKIRGHAS